MTNDQKEKEIKNQCLSVFIRGSLFFVFNP